MVEKAEILKLYKNLGETPLECLHRLKIEHPEYKDEKMTYLGRLDPMAEGLLLVLVGDTRSKNKYLELDKTYEFEVLWGFESDTYDVLGVTILTPSAFASTPLLDLGEGKGVRTIERLLKKIKSKSTQEYPAYSSKTVSGKALFMWAREDKIEEIDIPTRSIKIFDIEHIHTRYENGRQILGEVERKIGLVEGDFRQEKIRASWQNALVTRPNEMFMISKFRADVSSGTYIRGLVHDMGKLLKCGALAWSIKRMRVGEYKLGDRD